MVKSEIANFQHVYLTSFRSFFITHANFRKKKLKLKRPSRDLDIPTNVSINLSRLTQATNPDEQYIIIFLKCLASRFSLATLQLIQFIVDQIQNGIRLNIETFLLHHLLEILAPHNFHFYSVDGTTVREKMNNFNIGIAT